MKIGRDGRCIKMVFREKNWRLEGGIKIIMQIFLSNYTLQNPPLNFSNYLEES
jgi:hypothetical protein